MDHDTPLSSIGGAAQGGSTKPQEEREQVERQQPGRDDKGSGSSGQEAPMTPNAPQSGIDDGPGDSSSAGDGD